ncbi:MAG TPA: hypothetical protein VKA74_10525 [Myxococcota bacterium]|nr:hypothetical protein [Myxococcota bacterium]
MPSSRHACGVALGLLLALSWAACGAEDGGEHAPPSMIRETTGSAAERGDSRATSGPILDSLRIDPPRPAPGRLVEAQARATDAAGRGLPVEFRWRTGRGRSLGEGDRLDTTGLDPGRTIELVAIATDESGERTEQVLSFRLEQPSAEISWVAIDDSRGRTPGTVLSSVVETSDRLGVLPEPEIEWLVDGEVVGREEELDTTPFLPGSVIELRATLGPAKGSSRSVTSRPIVLARGEPPEIVSLPDGEIEGGLFSYRVQARSPEPGAELRYRLLTSPEGMSVDARSGVVRWRPNPEQRGRFEVEVGVVDQWGSGAAQSFSIQAESPVSFPARAR